MSSIKIRVGASLDANATKVFDPLTAAAERARKNIEKSLGSAAQGPERVRKASQTSGDKLIREVERMADKLVKDEEKAQKARVKEVEKAAKERIKLEKQAMREIERELDRHNRATERAQAKAERDRERNKRGWGGAIGIGYRAGIRVQRSTALGYGLVGGMAGAAINMAEQLASSVGIETSLAPHMARAIQLRQQASEAANAGYITGSAGAQGILQNPDDIIKDVAHAADKTAYSLNEAMAGLQAFVAQTGDLKRGRDILGDIATLSRATGSSLEDMANAAAQVSNQLPETADKAERISAVMRVIAGQGKLGAVEIKDLARQMAKVAANAGMFEGSIQKNIGELGLLAQEARLRGGAASAAQAATSVTAFANALSIPTTVRKHWIGGKGVNPYTDTKFTTLRSPEEIILKALQVTHGNKIALEDLFPNTRAMSAVRGFANIYNETKGSEKDKLSAVAEEFDNLRKAQLNEEEVTRAFSVAMDTTKNRVQVANNRLDEMAMRLEEAILPALANLAPALELLAPAVGSVIDKIASFFGFDPNADKEAKAKSVREERVKKLTEEYQYATFTGPLTAGEERSGRFHKGIDQSHLEQVVDDNAKQVGELTMARANVQREAEKPSLAETTSPEETAALVLGGGARDTAELQKQQGRVDAMTQETSQVRKVLEQIRDDILTKKLTVTIPTPPQKVTTDPSGRAPAESEHE